MQNFYVNVIEAAKSLLEATACAAVKQPVAGVSKSRMIK